MTFNDTTNVYTLRITYSFSRNRGFRQRVVLAATIFIVVLDQTIKGTNLKVMIIRKSMEIFAYADAITILERDKLSLRAFCTTVEEGKKRVLEINEKNSKIVLLIVYVQRILCIEYCVLCIERSGTIRTGSYEFEMVEELRNVGTLVSGLNERILHFVYRDIRENEKITHLTQIRFLKCCN